MSLHKEYMALAIQEPALLEVLRHVRAFKRAARDRTDVCANRLWIDHVKPELERLVGWSASNRALRTSDAFDTCRRHLYEKLPDCRNCCCLQAHVRVKATRPAQELSARLGGPYVHFLGEGGRIRSQGLIVDVQARVVQVLHFDWGWGAPRNTRWYPIGEIRACRLYRDADTWRAAAEMEQRPR